MFDKTSVCTYGNIHQYICIHYAYTIYTLYWIIEHIVWTWYSRYCIHCTFCLSCKKWPSIPDMQKETIHASMDGNPLQWSFVATCNQGIWCYLGRDFKHVLFSPPKNLTDIFQMSWNQQLVMRPRIIWLNWMIHPSKRLSFQKIWWKLHPDVKSHGVKGPGCFWLTVGPPVFRVFVGGFLKERFLMGKSGKYVEENPDMCYIGLRTSSYLRGLK